MQDEQHSFSCVIFDMDGTLTQTNELIFASFNHVAQKYVGKTLSNSEIIALFGPSEEGGLGKLVGEEKAGEAMDELCAFYREHHNAKAWLHQGVLEVLDHLQSRGIRLAIFTGKGKRTTEITLQQLGITNYFDLVVSGTDVAQHKPHHEGIMRILETFSLSPAQALMVGDALSDVKASRAAGVPIAAVVWDSYDKERVLQANPDYIFFHVSEMLAWFRQHIN